MNGQYILFSWYTDQGQQENGETIKIWIKNDKIKKNAKRASVEQEHNVFTEIFTIPKKKLALLYEKVEFLASPNQVGIVICC